jgi:hypothetical protein
MNQHNPTFLNHQWIDDASQSINQEIKNNDAFNVSPGVTYVLLHFKVDLSLYVILKQAS